MRTRNGGNCLLTFRRLKKGNDRDRFPATRKQRDRWNQPFRPRHDFTPQPRMRARIEKHARPPPAMRDDAKQPISGQASDQFGLVREQHGTGIDCVRMQPGAPGTARLLTQCNRDQFTE